jgi:hypothetical protein
VRPEKKEKRTEKNEQREKQSPYFSPFSFLIWVIEKVSVTLFGDK